MDKSCHLCHPRAIKINNGPTYEDIAPLSLLYDSTQVTTFYITAMSVGRTQTRWKLRSSLFYADLSVATRSIHSERRSKTLKHLKCVTLYGVYLLVSHLPGDILKINTKLVDLTPERLKFSYII